VKKEGIRKKRVAPLATRELRRSRKEGRRDKTFGDDGSI